MMNGSRQGVVVLGLLLGLAAQLSFWLVFSSAQAIGSIGSCGRTILAHDYLKPLDRMPSLQEPPASGRMAFAPATIKLASNEGRLVAGGGSLGFTIENKGEIRRHLGWIVETELSKINRKGRVVATLGTKSVKVDSMHRDSIRQFLYAVSSAPAFYRVDIRFQDKDSGHMLGKFSSYARVVKKRIELGITIEKPSVLADEYARATLVNPGTVPIEFGSWHFGYRVESFSEEEGRWKGVADNPPILAPLLPRHPYYLPAGAEVVGCLRYLVPTDQPPALFRFTTIGKYAQKWTNVARAGFEVAGY